MTYDVFGEKLNLNAQSSNGEESCKTFLDPDSDADDDQNLIISSLYTDTAFWYNLHEEQVVSTWSSWQTDKKTINQIDQEMGASQNLGKVKHLFIVQCKVISDVIYK